MPNYTLGGDSPQSRSEKILMKQNSGPAQSRIEELLKNSSSGRTSGAFVYKGSVETSSSLPSSSNEVGDVYHINSDGSEWAWNGSNWEELGKPSDLDPDSLSAWLNEAGSIIHTLTLSGTTVTLDKSFASVYNNLVDSARQNLFILPIGGTEQNPVVLILSPKKADAQTYSITLGDEYNGNRYSVTLSAAAVNANPMTGTLVTEPLNELPTVSSSDNGKFLRVVSGAWAAQAVPSAESNSFGGGST